MKIAIIGASGLVGSSLMEDITFCFRNDCQVIGTYHQHSFDNGVRLDITDKEDIRRFVASYRPDILIWLAGSKELKLLESNPGLSRVLNEKPIDDLLDVINTGSIKPRLMYISSDYVFDGNRGNYASEDVRSPDTVYGRSKAYVEDRLRESGIESVSLRTSAIMNAKGGFFSWLLGQIKCGDAVNLYSNTIFSPTPSVSFNKVVERIIRESLWGGVLHFAGDAMSRYEFGRKITDLLGEDSSRIRPAIADIAHSTFHYNLSLITSRELLDLAPSDEDMMVELKRYD